MSAPEVVRVPTAPGLRGFAPEPAAVSQPEALVPSRDTYRGWTISYDPPPIPIRYFDWTATGPNYDAWTEGEGDWTDNGEKAAAATRDGLLAEIDNWFEENA